MHAFSTAWPAVSSTKLKLAPRSSRFAALAASHLLHHHECDKGCTFQSVYRALNATRRILHHIGSAEQMFAICAPIGYRVTESSEFTSVVRATTAPPPVPSFSSNPIRRYFAVASPSYVPSLRTTK